MAQLAPISANYAVKSDLIIGIVAIWANQQAFICGIVEEIIFSATIRRVTIVIFSLTEDTFGGTKLANIWNIRVYVLTHRTG